MEASIQVFVQNLAGCVLQVEVEVPALVHKLKEKVCSSTWRVPPICQRLIMDSRILEDAERLSDLTSAGIYVSLVVSPQILYEKLLELPSKLSRPVIMYESDRAHNERVRNELVKVIEALVEVVPSGDELALDALFRALDAVFDHAERSLWIWCDAVVRSVMRALHDLAPVGDMRTIELAHNVIKRHPSVRNFGSSTVVVALQLLAQVDGESMQTANFILESFQNVSKQNQTWEPKLDAQVCKGLANLQHMCTDKAHRYVLITTAIRRLESHDALAKHIAMHVLTTLRAEDEPFAFDAVSSRMSQLSGRPKRSVGEVLTSMLHEGSMAMIDTFLEHEDAIVRKAASAALCRVVQKGDDHAVARLVHKLGHKSAEVREVALRLLPQLAYKDNDELVGALQMQLCHTDPHVRMIALQALTKVVGAARKQGIKIASGLLVDDDARVRNAAQQAIRKMSDHSKGHRKVHMT